MEAFRMRTSKFRHVYGKPYRKEMCFENIRLTKNAHDGCFCAVNPKSLAVATESAGGGAFLVLRINQFGRIDINAPKVCGHAGAVLDLKWNPFDDNILASGSDDATVKIWQIPEEGLSSNLTEWQVDLHGHQRRVTYIDWHPTASNILLSAGFDYKCYIWNVEQAEPVNVIGCHTDTIFSMSWSREGAMFATTSKDKKLRVIDPRSTEIVAEANCHPGNKPSKTVFLEDSQRLLTTGFTRQCERQLAIWDIRNMSSSQRTEAIDNSSGIIQPFYDPDIRVVFLAGKGDGNIRFFEITNDSSFFHYLNEYMSSSPQRGLGRMPKIGCDATKCEIVRFYKMHGSKNLLEPISMIVPRKSEQFQEDIFPPTAGSIPSLTADEWVSGQNREPILVSLQDGQVTNTPKVTTSRPVQRQDGGLQSNPVITTYTAVSRSGRSSQQMKRANTIASSTEVNNIPTQEPASIKNIKRLSINEEIVTFDDASQDLGQKRAMFEQTTNNNNNNNNVSLSVTDRNSSHYEKKVWSPISPKSPTTTTNGLSGSDSEQELSPFKPSDMSGLELSPLSANDSVESDVMEWRTNAAYQRRKRPLSSNYSPSSNSSSSFNSLAKLVIGEPSPQSQTNKIHVRKVWHMQPAPSPSVTTDYNSHNFQTDLELKKAYFRQQEEIRSLQEQLKLKDKRINQLEDELRRIKDGSSGNDESNC